MEPKMAPYIFMEKNGIHIIDLHKTVLKIDEAAAALKQIAKSGRRVLFVATKKQAKEIVAERWQPSECPTSPSAGPAVCLRTSPPYARP
ncbi:Ribosomal protein S2 [human gut metagenome]|uniref:Ribosomal protein S2 n=1 Tax=human gut metagenome TaxID=408170 RepID=K1V010_9ZZZZ